MKKLALPAILFFFLTGCGPLNKTLRPTPAQVNKIEKLAVVVTQKGQFTVIDERAHETATPAVLFGLTGALLASAYNQGLDSQKAKTFSGEVINIPCKSLFAESFRNALSEYKHFHDAVFLDQEPKPENAKYYDAVVNLEILSWGLRVTERSREDVLKPFLKIHAQLVDAKGNKLWDEQDIVVGHEGNSLLNYQHDSKLFKRDMEDAIKSAGREMAVFLIYQ